MSTRTSLFQELKVPLRFILLLWIIHSIQYFTGLSFARLGVYSREIEGFFGIFTSPFIHGSWEHLAHNSVPLLMSWSMIWLFYPSIKWKALGWIYILTGIGVWVFGRHVYHIGASGVVYGLISFLFFNGAFRGNLKSFGIALIIILLYSGMLAGIVPREPGISWESHLIGAIVGAIVSYAYRNYKEADEIERRPSWETNPEKQTYFLPRDIFLKTKKQRALEEQERQRLERERQAALREYYRNGNQNPL